jgi:uncharacterized protein YbjT (DUF2867 family)
MSHSEELHVVFGSDPIGSAIMSELLTQGHKVRIVNRHAKMNVPEGVALVQGDATVPAFTKDACKDATVSTTVPILLIHSGRSSSIHCRQA